MNEPTGVVGSSGDDQLSTVACAARLAAVAVADDGWSTSQHARPCESTSTFTRRNPRTHRPTKWVRRRSPAQCRNQDRAFVAVERSVD
jgi:hypothetical protein